MGSDRIVSSSPGPAAASRVTSMRWAAISDAALEANASASWTLWVASALASSLRTLSSRVSLTVTSSLARRPARSRASAWQTIDRSRRTVAEMVDAALPSFLHPFAKPTRPAFTVIARGEGALVWDRDGNEYVDAMASLWYCAAGH